MTELLIFFLEFLYFTQTDSFFILERTLQAMQLKDKRKKLPSKNKNWQRADKEQVQTLAIGIY